MPELVVVGEQVLLVAEGDAERGFVHAKEPGELLTLLLHHRIMTFVHLTPPYPHQMKSYA